MPFFSVVIPLYNKQNFIAATLQSILAQTFTDFEVIVVNDVSTDGSVAVVNTFNDTRIKIVQHTKNSGLSASRNTGVKHASAKYIAFIDADDAWKPIFLTEVKKLIDAYPQAGLYATQYLEVYPNGVEIAHVHKVAYGLVPNFFEAGLRQPLYCQSGFCVKKEVFEVAGYYDESITFSEDIDFNIRANYHFKLAYTPQPLTLYYIHQQGQMTVQGLAGKVIPNLDKYEPLAQNRPDIKQYLDFYRYVYARWYKMEGNTSAYKKILGGLTPSNLNYKQRLLLKAPVFALQLLRKVKARLIKKGVNPTTY
jgi:glycosyltransferase involved in cell wall biosynthesis